ncbi:MAG: hypothetical protein IMZ65_01620 [Planctomycetes bacterium]|nr:hypothetical protein [Planctomycetota bacterium]
MKRFTLGALVALFALAFGAAAWAGEVPWKAGDGDKKEAGDAAGGAGDLKTDLGEAQYNRIVKPVEAQVEKAEKIMEKYSKEMEKEEPKRNQTLLLGLKDQAANAYLAASLAAKKGAGMVRKPEQKAAITEQFDDPNRQKAVDFLLELAQDAQEKKDLRKAVAYYKKVLAIDKENSVAKDALTKIAEDMKAAAKAPNKKGGKGGSSEDPKSWQREDPSNTGRGDNNWSGAGRSW